MTRTIWIGSIAVAVLIAGGWWYFSQPGILVNPGTAELPATHAGQPSTQPAPQPAPPGRPEPTVSGLSASPLSGRAPLTVTFTSADGTTGDGTTNPTWIDYGDGSTEPLVCTPAYHCSPPARTVHTYTKAGTYTAEVVQGIYDFVILGGVSVTVR